MSDTVSSDSVAQDQLRAFIERIENLETEKKAIADDIREIYAEAKGNGFDTVVLRRVIKIRAMDHAERMEQEAILDLYMSALGMQAAPRDSVPLGKTEGHAADRATEATPPASVATQSRLLASEDHGLASEPVGNSLAGAEGDADRHPIQTGGHTLDQGEGDDHPSGVLPDQSESATTADPAGSDLTPAASRPNSPAIINGDTGETVSTPVSPVAIPKPFRPHCLDRQACAGMGNHHCSRCERAYLAKLDPVG